MIKHIKCDIFESGADVICHQVNCQGVMGSGVAKQVRERYPDVFTYYKERCDYWRNSDFGSSVLLGGIQVVPIETGWIVNLLAQDKFGYDGKCYTDYNALRRCLEKVKDEFHEETIAIPYLMGCHRGGGDWNIVYKMIEEVFADSDCEVLICEYNGG
jgi:O-acetyl-ADP-ribose deacetylase (regulator of RNase III)